MINYESIWILLFILLNSMFMTNKYLQGQFRPLIFILQGLNILIDKT